MLGLKKLDFSCDNFFVIFYFNWRYTIIPVNLK